MRYYLVVPAVVLLAAVVYLLFLYDPNPSNNSNNGASMAPGEPKQIGSSEIGTATVTDAVDLKMAPVTVPSAKELSDETESMENFVSAADDNTTEETTEETTLAAAVDDSTEESITSAGVGESMEETIPPVAAGESIEDSSPEDRTAKRVTYVKTDSFDSPQADSSADDDSREAAPQVEEVQSQSIVADDQKQLSGSYIERQAVITSSLSQATSDAGLSANQSARIGRVFEPYLDSRRELRKGDKLTILLDPGAGKTGNDAEQVHRLEFHGARKTLVVTRKEGSLSDYEVRNADGKMLNGKVSQASLAVEKSRREASVEPAPRSAADNNASTGSMKRIEGVPGESSGTHNGDENSSARKPFWKRLGSGSSNGDEKSGARKPFWKRLGFGSSSAVEGSN